MFRTLDDLKGKKDDSKNPKKTTNSYAGGEKSGIAIQNPDDLNGIIEKADRNPSTSKSSSNDNTPADQKCKIRLYQNGFQIDDGEFRDYNSEQNKLFLKELNQQQVPTELRAKFPKGLSVGLEDRRSEVYRPPTPPSYVAFSGQSTSISGQSVSIAQQQNHQLFLNKGEIIVDESKPATNIQVRLHNGKTVKIRVNNSDSVSVLYNYVNSIAPIQGGSFDLIAGFPPTALKNKQISIEQADLLESRVTQKIL